MKILLVGGGSGGPVSPLLAVAEQIKKTHPKAQFLLIGGKTGPERAMSAASGIAFVSITAGKWRRYLSWENIKAPFQVIAGILQARKILNEFRPDCVFATGSFIQVPVVWAAKLKHIPIVLHQQDLLPSLANRLCQLAARKISVTFEADLAAFSSSWGVFYKKTREDKVVLTGNPFRQKLTLGSRPAAEKIFELNDDLPVLLVLGGGTGAEFFNQLISKSLPQLTKTVQIIHSTGPGKYKPVQHNNYHPYEFIYDMGNAYAAADIVLARAGLSTLTELSNLKKFSIIIPLPGTHQELNADYLSRLQAAVVLDQQKVTAEGFIRLIRKLLFEPDFQNLVKTNISEIMPKQSARKIAEIIIKLAEST